MVTEKVKRIAMRLYIIIQLFIGITYMIFRIRIHEKFCVEQNGEFPSEQHMDVLEE